MPPQIGLIPAISPRLTARSGWPSFPSRGRTYHSGPRANVRGWTLRKNIARVYPTILRLLREQQREHEAHAPGGRAVGPHGVIFAEHGDAERLRADLQDLADAADDRHGPRLRRPVVGGLRLQVQRGVGREGVGNKGIEKSRTEGGRPAGRNRDRASVVAQDRAAAESVIAGRADAPDMIGE